MCAVVLLYLHCSVRMCAVPLYLPRRPTGLIRAFLAVPADNGDGDRLNDTCPGSACLGAGRGVTKRHPRVAAPLLAVVRPRDQPVPTCYATTVTTTVPVDDATSASRRDTHPSCAYPLSPSDLFVGVWAANAPANEARLAAVRDTWARDVPTVALAASSGSTRFPVMRTGATRDDIQSTNAKGLLGLKHMFESPPRGQMVPHRRRR